MSQQTTGTVLSALLSAMVDPVSSPPLRFAAQGQPSACVTETYTEVLDWTAATVNRRVQAQEMQVFLFKDLFKGLVIYDPNPSTLAYRYDIYTESSTLIATFAFRYGHVALGGLYATPSSAYQPHGAILHPVLLGGHQGWWLDNDGTHSSTLNVEFNVAPAANNTGAIRWYSWSGDTWVPASVSVFVAGTVKYSSNTSFGGYLRAEICGIDATSLATATYYIEAVAVISPATWRHIVVPNAATLAANGARASRITAASISLMIAPGPGKSPPPPVLTNADLITAAELPPCLPFITQTTGVAGLATVKTVASPVSNGYRGFIRPAEMGEFRYNNSIGVRERPINSMGPVGNSIGSFPGAIQTPYLTAVISIANAPSRRIRVTASWTVEYLTEIAAIPTFVSAYTINDFNFALWVLSYGTVHFPLATTNNQIISTLFGLWRRSVGIPLNN